MLERYRVLLIVGPLLLIGIVATFYLKHPLAWTVVPIIISAAWMLGDPKRLLAGYWLYAVVVEYVYQMTARGIVRYGDEALLGLIVVALVFQQALRRRSHQEFGAVPAIFWSMCVLLGLSYLVNRGDTVRAAVTAVQYFRPFALGYLAYISLRREDLSGACKLFFATLIVQFVLNLGWLFGLQYPPHPGLYIAIDFAVGTMGSSLQVGYTACLGFVLAVAIFHTTTRVSYLIVAGVLVTSFVLTNTAHGYAFLAIMLLVMALMPARRALAHAATVASSIVLLAVLAFAMQTVLPYSMTFEQYVRRAKDLAGGRKTEAYVRHFTELHNDVPVFVLGAGPGNLGCAMASKRSFLASKYHGWSFQRTDLLERVQGSIISHTRTGFLAIWGDLGPIVFLLYWGLHVYAILRVGRAYRRGAYSDPWQQALALSFVPAMLLYLMVAFMTDLIHTALWGFYPWVWAAMVWMPQSTELSVDEASTTEPVQQLDETAVAKLPV